MLELTKCHRLLFHTHSFRCMGGLGAQPIFITAGGGVLLSKVFSENINVNPQTFVMKIPEKLSQISNSKDTKYAIPMKNAKQTPRTTIFYICRFVTRQFVYKYEVCWGDRDRSGKRRWDVDGQECDQGIFTPCHSFIPLLIHVALSRAHLCAPFVINWEIHD